MHIPDGYLSPATCGTLFLGAAPFWYLALRRVKKTLHTRMIPLLSVFAAFSFVIMMFNLPLPGGTTGHAVGMGIAAIVLGPWASILAISVALLIQAVFFGDGGITALGANCFNMAIVGSLASFGVYRLISARAGIGATRRVVAAGMAGYAAINIAALCAAIEFGIQPLLFRDATGAPLYAPYSLSVSIPAMMLGHLTFAGFAELIITAGVVAYLQRADPGLLRHTAPNAPSTAIPSPMTARKLWIGLAGLQVLTPLGILAVGGAWGEWSARDFANARARQQITVASSQHAPPDHAPQGLERLSSVWTAPLPGYAPSFIRSPSFGYLISGLLGVGLILLVNGIVRRLVSGRRRASFVEKTARGLFETLQRALFAEEMAQTRGFLQRLDARVKLVGLGALIVADVAVHRLPVLCGLFVLSVVLALVSHVQIRTLAGRIWVAVLLFTGAIALPAIFLTPGQPVFHLAGVNWEVTQQGLMSASFLLLRAETTATLSVLLILCTLWTQLLRAFRFFHLPVVLVVILGMTYRYIFLFLQTAQDMFTAREARLVGVLEPAASRRLATASVAVLLEKSLQLSGEVHTAMQARGFRGEVYLLDDLSMRANDWLRLSVLGGIAFAAVWFGR